MAIQPHKKQNKLSPRISVVPRLPVIPDFKRSAEEFLLAEEKVVQIEAN